MNPLAKIDPETLAALCREHSVKRLAVFGSLIRDDFDPERSDADFLVEFDPAPPAVRMRNFLGLRHALGVLLNRPIDLVEQGAIRNPFVLQSVARQEQVLYAA